MLIDTHNHYYPPAYIDALRRGPSAITITEDEEGNPVLNSPGDRNYAVRGHRDISYREGVLEQHGIDKQVISLTCPGTVVETPDRSVALARLVNDAMAEIRQTRGSRFIPLATLPLNVPDAAVPEFERATKELGLVGCMLFSNVAGVALSDQRYWPLYERANDAHAVFYIHPTYPLGVEAMLDYWLMPLVGFLMDTTLAAASLVFSGVVERFPNIRWVLGHLGGTIPYLVERLDRGFENFPECRENISKPPSEYLRKFYYDTVNFDARALRLAIEFAGSGQILAGSDYPHLIGSIPSMLRSIRSLGLAQEDEARILGGNAAALFS